MQRAFLVLIPCALLAGGCVTSPYPPSGGPKVDPDPLEWKRKSIPAPPLYMEFTTGDGNQWTMVTPLYWQVEGAQSSSKLLFPFAHASSDDARERTGGHVLNCFWSTSPQRSVRGAFPFYWSFRSPTSATDVYGPVYRKVNHATGNRKLVVFPWLYSRETGADGYSYWGVLGRLLGHEKQMFGKEARERLWLFFVFHIDLG